MVPNRVRLVLIVSALLALPFLTPLRAQFVQMAPAKETFGEPKRDWTDDVPAHLAFVDGQVTLERDGKLEPAVANMALLAGDRLRTLGGRVEILYSDGSTLAVDEQTEIDLLDDSLVRLVDGRLRITIPRSTEDLDYRIDAPAAFVEIKTAGEYRVDTGVDQHGADDVDLVVFRGQAELVNDLGRTLVRAGKHAVATGTEEPSLPYPVNSAAWDEFDRWSDDRRNARVGSGSAAYLPEEERYYSSALDYNGTWETEADYGPVWYPRVADDWRPYSQGSWSYTSHYGWLWVGIDSWSWPTHHYGRWGVSGSRWFWIPGRQWGPAWVAWGSAPGFVSWCPLGLDGHATVGFRPIDVPNIGVRSVDPFMAWTIMPVSGFAHNVWVTEHAVPRGAVPPQIRGQFTERPVAPMPVGNAVAKRDITPIHAPTAPRNVATSRDERSTRGPFDAARTSGGAGGGARPRTPISSTIIGPPPVQTSGAGDETRALPGSRSVMPDQPAAPPSRVPRPATTSIEIPRVQTPPDATSRSVAPPPANQNRTTPARAIPRPDEQPVAPPAAVAASPRSISRPQEPVQAAAPPPDPSRDRGHAGDRPTPTPAPTQPAAPPPAAAGAAGGGRASEPPPATGQQPAAPPPAAGATPPATPPAGRGGGRGGGTTTTTTTQGTGAGRGGGGGRE